ncbi:hypothetical protein B6D12_08525 [Gilliamella apicola]|jgi:hypothetical protein|uniref:putative holin n=1 Tax=Gilliamella TaxID=1193503 RepID=UPI00081052ED|nr:putative holin [Gilliamella apicola]OCF91721.1 hypothetical protein A9G17_00600 [Gilliamella apicola]OTP87492.1 hypothetical protein B5S41_12050 [Gilliamella apicola]OTP92501.1 hypothetical protein B6D13_12500 [Gilliamella apicola]OTP98569.1 hypothetical protein B6D07_12940 [Gilliamella apicola]OTQ02231.1 hypothetical protein B5S43_07525 [Gilliamella apicola]
MTEPTSLTFTSFISAFSLSMIYPNIENGIILGALCGSILLVISEQCISLLRRIVLFLISFSMGLLLAEMTLYLLIPIFPTNIQTKMPLGLGALISSAISVKLLLWLIKKFDDPTNFFNYFRGKKS